MAFPTTGVLDDFNRASLGSNWTQGLMGDVDLAIDTNAVESSAGDWGAAYYNVATYGPDCENRITLLEDVAKTRNLLLRLAITTLTNFDGYGVECNNTAFCKVWRYDDGTATKLGSDFSISGIATNSEVGFEASGSTLTVYHKASGGSWASVTSRTDSTYNSAGYLGLEIYYNTSRSDDFGGGTIVVPTLEQEGARFRNDDGSETAATWAAAQDANLTAPLSANLRARFLVNASAGDPASTAYKLKYQKNGAGGYLTVPIVAAADPVTPVIEAADCTVSGNNTAQATWAVSHPNASTGDLLIFYIAWDDSTATTDVAEPSGPNGETLTEINATPITDSATETRAKAWYCKATGSWTAGTVTFTPTATESWSATVIRVPAGEFDATTPIGASQTRTTTGTADTAALSPAFTAGASDGYGKLVWCAGVDTDPLTGTITNWTILQQQDLGAVAHGVAVRNAAVTNSESIAGGNTWTIAGDSWTSIAFIVRAPAGVANGLYVATSSNITAGGEATTAQLTAPSGKTTGDFVAGRMWDNENGSDSIDITSQGYTELEWCLYAQSPTVNGDYFDLRVYAADVALDTYTVTPRWTIGSISIHFYQVTLNQAVKRAATY